MIRGVYSMTVVATLVTVLISRSNCEEPSDEEDISLIDLGCFLRQHQNICYTMDKEQMLNQSGAAAECARRHTGGRLAAIPDQNAQDQLVRLLEYHELQSATFWIGAELKFLDEWTWIDDSTDDIPSSQLENNHGFASCHITRQLECHSVMLYDPAGGEKSALCKSYDCNPPAARCYFNTTARRWFEARNKCLSSSADLAVLSSEAVSSLLSSSVAHQDHDYFVGLRNVKITWQQTNEEAKYTNWILQAPRRIDETCVMMSHIQNQWDVGHCYQSAKFICEYAAENTHSQERDLTYRQRQSGKNNGHSISQLPAGNKNDKARESATNRQRGWQGARDPRVQQSTRRDSQDATTSTITTTASTTNWPQSAAPTTSTVDSEQRSSTDEIRMIVVVVLCLLLVIAIVIVVALVCYFKRRSSTAKNDQLSYENIKRDRDSLQPYTAISDDNGQQPDIINTSRGTALSGPEYAEIAIVPKSQPASSASVTVQNEGAQYGVINKTRLKTQKPSTGDDTEYENLHETTTAVSKTKQPKRDPAAQTKTVAPAESVYATIA